LEFVSPVTDMGASLNLPDKEDDQNTHRLGNHAHRPMFDYAQNRTLGPPL